MFGAGTLRNGLIGALLIIPVFAFRHYVQDKGVFPSSLVSEYAAQGGMAAFKRRAGWRPWATLGAAAAVIALTRYLAVTP